ncbi:MAG: DUF2922 family protein [Synergistaceae bacterium]|nr:DUF2922 family protein [Synergistaceae bacterium]MBR0095418.1 DUF2922 family protein [Synergistaceae bacterium]
MSTITRLAMEFKDSNNDTFSVSYNYANPEAGDQKVRNLANAIVAYGSVFQRVPVDTKSAKFITTTTTEVDLNG